MKITIDEKPAAPKIEYPCLMQTDDDDVVLFVKLGCGIAIRHPDGQHYSNDWAMGWFTPFTGSVTLSND